MPAFDAVLVPSGGLTPEGQLPAFVAARVERACQRHEGAPIVFLSAGTTHKPLPCTPDGFPLFEAVVGARYAESLGVPQHLLLAETCSYDTIGNAYFARVAHSDPAGWRRLLVVNSVFHMPRTEAVFRWVFGLPGNGRPYELEFDSTPDVGIAPDALAARRAKERDGLANVQRLASRIQTLPALHDWLFEHHAAYAWALDSREEQVQGLAAATY